MVDDAELLARDVAARDAALDASGSFIVQAPAGSGKTGLLIQRYLRLLAIVDTPEEILAITFTRKAAREMQYRIVNALRDAADNRKGESAHEQRTLDLARAAIDRDDERNWGLLASPGRMRIETVDAFCAGVARSLPLSSGLGGIGTTLADAEIRELYQEAAAATLDYLADSEGVGQCVARLLTHLDNETGAYVSHIARMLASREQWLEITGSGIGDGAAAEAARSRLEGNIADIVTRQLQSLDNWLQPVCGVTLPPLLAYAAENLHAEGQDDHPLAALTDAAELPAPDCDHREAWQGIANLLLTKQGSWRKSVNKNDGFPAGNKDRKEELYDVIASLRDSEGLRETLERTRRLPAPVYPEDQWEMLLALFELLPQAVAELKRLFAERGVTDHSEVSMAAGRALGSPDAPGDVALALDYRVRHLLVDEMQDTSIAQYGLLRKLTMGWTADDGRTMFCVGDPMQSIYRFRDAEVGEFILAQQGGIGETSLSPLTLRRNFRSGENLVHWFNTVFDQVMPHRDDIAAGAISYSASVPVDGNLGVGDYHLHALFDAEHEDEAQRTFDIVQACLRSSTDEDVAVLVRSRSHLAELLRLFRDGNVSYKSVEIDRLTDLPEVIDVVALTRALCHEGDRLAWLALLRAPWTGLCWADIHTLVLNDTKSSVRELIADDARRAAMTDDGRQRLRRFVGSLEPHLRLNATMSLRDRVEAAWCALGGPATLSDPGQVDNVYRFLEILERLETAGTLEDVRELDSRLDDERVSSQGMADCRVQVMTMHKAKGLEFDHVVLHGLGRTSRGSTRDVLSWLNVPDETGASEMIISPVGPRAAIENDPIHQFIESTDAEKSTAELDRLLYVACTRARKSLHLVGNVDSTADGERLRKPDRRSLLSRLWPAVSVNFEQAFGDANSEIDSAVEEHEDEDDVDGFVLPALNRFESAWQPPVAASLPGERRDDDIAENADAAARVEYYWVGSAARHAGTIVHRWLQRMSDGLTSTDTGDIRDCREMTRRWAVDLGVQDIDLDAVVERVEDALHGILSDTRGRWLLEGEGESELRLTGIVDRRVETVILDRIRIDEDGTHWIVDYKTSTHEGGDVEGFLQQEADRYRPQLARYAAIYSAMTGVTPKTALYFPLLRAFTEIDV